MVNKPVSARHHLASLALAVLATFSTSIHAQATISAGDTTYRGSFTTDAKTGAVNGTGTVQWKSGNRYEGPVVNTQLTGKGVRTAKVVVERKETTVYTLKLPAVDDTTRSKLNGMKSALSGKPLQSCT